MAGAAGGREGFLSSSPAPEKVKWKPKAEPWRQAGSPGSEEPVVGGENTKLSVRKRMGRAFFPREAVSSPTSRGFGYE